MAKPALARVGFGFRLDNPDGFANVVAISTSRPDMVKLTFNPDGANSWVATLKEGDNMIGRAADNDVCVQDGGVSNHHCRVSVGQGTVTITDLNSTNGVSSNGSRITQATWAPGQVLHLGPIAVRLESGPAGHASPALAAVSAPAMARLSINAAVPVATSTTSANAPSSSSGTSLAGAAPRLRLSGIATAPAAAPASPATSPEPEAEAASAEGSAPATGPAFIVAPPNTRCRSHNAAPARWSCPKCHKYFCDLCVNTRATGGSPAHLCRACGVECFPVQLEFAAETGQRGFFARVPGAFAYPLRGMGLLVLITATVVFAALSAMAGIFSILLTMAATGYLFLFLQNIIHSTAADEDKMPSLPEFDGLFGAFFTLAGTVVISFIVPVGLGIAKLADVDIPMNVLVAAIFVSLLYFPMAFLAVAIMDSVTAANPLVVIPSILRVPGQYIVTVLLLCAVFGVRLLGDVMSSAAGDLTYTTTDMSVLFATLAGRAVWSFISIYLLTVCMRILGLLYLTQRDRLGWL